MDTTTLSGKVAVVTGTLGLLGREHAAALALQGADLMLVDIDAAGLATQARELEREFGVRVAFSQTDISSATAVNELVAELHSEFERVDILVNNAAVDDKFEPDPRALSRSCFEEYPIDAWQRVLDVNVTGTFLCCQRIGAMMAERGRGSIINVASTYGLVAPDQSLYRRKGEQLFFKTAAYPVSKAAVIQLTRFVATYWGTKGVRANALCPGGVQHGQPEYFVSNYSERTPLGRMASASDYRGALVFLASDASNYMTGATLVVDGGYTAW